MTKPRYIAKELPGQKWAACDGVLGKLVGPPTTPDEAQDAADELNAAEIYRPGSN